MKRNTTASDALWRSYRETGDTDARAMLLSQYIGLVHHTVRQIAARVGDAVDYDDLVGAGSLGLVRAFEGFDAERGIAFTTYATQRVRGAVLDELRAADRLPRGARAQARAVTQTRTALSQKLARPATPDEVASELNIDLATYWEWTDLAHGGGMVPLDATTSSGAATLPPIADRLHNPDAVLPDSALDVDDRRRVLRDAIATLPEQQRTVLALCYDEGLTLRQIAEVMHVTESRISQVRTAAIKALRDQIKMELS